MVNILGWVILSGVSVSLSGTGPFRGLTRKGDSMEEKLLRELVLELKRMHATIEVMQQDINCIRNGEYERPQGAAPAAVSGSVDPRDLSASKFW